MRLLVVLITFNRLEYTKKTLKSLRETLTVPHSILIVDNNSTDGTQEWLQAEEDNFIINPENYYPGKACNIGWETGLADYDATHLMRCDNDMEFKPGWDKKAEEYFRKIDRLGQLGLDYDGGEGKVPQFYNNMGLVEWPGCVGGPCIIRRQIWDDGHRYDETPWEGSNTRLQEDARFSKKLQADGWLVGHMDERLSYTFATMDTWKDYPDYYRKTMTDRDYKDRLEQAGL